MMQRQASIIDVERSGASRTVVVAPTGSSPGDPNSGGGGTGPGRVNVPFIQFQPNALTVLDTSQQATVRLELVSDEGLPQGHVVPITATLTASGTADSTHYNIGSLQVSIAAQATFVDITIGIVNDSLGSGESVELILAVSAVETNPQAGFEAEGAQSLITVGGDFTLTIENDTALDATALTFAPTRVFVTGLDYENQTIRVNASRPAPAGGITATFTVGTSAQAEFNQRVSLPSTVTIAAGETFADVELRGLTDTSVADLLQPFAYSLTLTDIQASGNVELGAVDNVVLVTYSRYPLGTRRIGWTELESETREGGDVVELAVGHQLQFDPTLAAQFVVSTSGSAIHGQDYTLDPPPGTVMRIEGEQSQVPLTVTPLTNTVFNETERTIELLISTQLPQYAQGQVTVLDGAAQLHTTTLLPDDAPSTYEVQFDRPGHTFDAAGTYEVGVTLSAPQQFEVIVAFSVVSNGLSQAQVGLGALTQLRIPAGLDRQTFTLTLPSQFPGADTAIARVVLDDVITPGGVIGDQDNFTVVRLGDNDDGLPVVPAITATLKQFEVYANRVEFDGTVYPCPAGGAGVWGNNGGPQGSGTQPFDLPDLRAKYYEVWSARNPGGVRKGEQGAQVATQIMEDVEFLRLRIGSDAFYGTQGLEWYEGAVPQPVRDLAFYSAGNGLARKVVRSIDVVASSTMPFVDNLLLRGLKMQSRSGVLGAQLEKPISVQEQAGAQESAHIYVDGVAFQDYQYAYNETGAPTSQFDQGVQIGTCVSVVARASLVVAGGPNGDIGVGRATRAVVLPQSNGFAYVADVTSGRELGALVDQGALTTGVMAHGMLSVVNCSQPALNVSRGVYLQYGLFGIATLAGLSVRGANSATSSIIVGGRGPTSYQRYFQYPWGFASSPWYQVLQLRIDSTTSNDFVVTRTGGASIGLMQLSKLYSTSIGEFDANGLTDAPVLHFNVNSFPGAFPRDWKGTNLAGTVPSSLFSRPTGTVFPGAPGPINGQLLSYAGTSDSTDKYAHTQAVGGVFDTIVFPDTNPPTDSYDGSNL